MATAAPLSSEILSQSLFRTSPYLRKVIDVLDRDRVIGRGIGFGEMVRQTGVALDDPIEVLQRAVGPTKRMDLLSTLRAFHQIVTRGRPRGEVPLQVQAVMAAAFSDQSGVRSELHPTVIVKRYFAAIGQALRESALDVFADSVRIRKKPDETALIGTELLGAGLGEYARPLIEEVIDRSARIRRSDERRETSTKLAHQLARSGMGGASTLPLFEKLLAGARKIQSRFERALALSEIAREMAQAGFKEEANKGFLEALGVSHIIAGEREPIPQRAIIVIRAIVSDVAQSALPTFRTKILFNILLVQAGDVTDPDLRAATVRQISLSLLDIASRTRSGLASRAPKEQAIWTASRIDNPLDRDRCQRAEAIHLIESL